MRESNGPFCHRQRERADITSVNGRGFDTRVTGVRASEVAMIGAVTHGVRRAGGPTMPAGRDAPALPGDRVHSFIRFANPLAYCYDRPSVTIHGNVVKATHGETQREALGNGNAAGPRQSFALKRAPLTFLAAPTAAGAVNTLQVLVDDIRWRELPSLLDSGPADRVYTARTDADGKAELVFPDGRDGARPPTGTQNIRAVYRVGAGRPAIWSGAGWSARFAAAGPARSDNRSPRRRRHAEDDAQTHRNAPITTMALERLVSVRDHEDFARSFAGIAKAEARVVSDGRRRLVYLTVAAEDDAPLDPSSELLLNLRRAIRNLSDPGRSVRLFPRELRLLILSARLRIDADRSGSRASGMDAQRSSPALASHAQRARRGLRRARPSPLSRPCGAWPGSISTRSAQSDTMFVPPGKPRAAIADDLSASVAQVAARPPIMGAGHARRRPSRATFPAQLLMLSPDIPATLFLNQVE